LAQACPARAPRTHTRARARLQLPLGAQAPTMDGGAQRGRSPSSGSVADDDDAVFFVSLQYRGASYDVPVQTGDSISSVFDFVQEALDFPRDNCKLICRGKVLRPDDAVSGVGEARLTPGSKLMLVATSVRDVAAVQNARPDPLVKGFAEEERDEKRRQKRAKQAAISAWGTKQDPEYRFGSIKAEFKYSTPPPYDAERLLQKLSTDPGIIEIMQTRYFKVGVLTEMSPEEAKDRMAKKGTPNMDLLGYNMNNGDMIVLKLRTDNVKGFRPYHDLINTLLHELTHNVWGPHDHNFWKLYGELKAQYMRFHRFWSHGGRAADSNAVGQFEGFAGDDGEDVSQEGNFGRVLGGSGDDTMPDAERRALAAESRSASANAGGGFDFLGSGGSPVFVCPCGLIHGQLDCPKGFEATTAAVSECGEDGLAEKVEDAEPPALPSLENAGSELGSAMEAAVPPPTDQALASATDQYTEAAVEVSALMPLSEAPTMADSHEESSVTVPEDTGPSFSAEDLAAFGLDGASLWLERFSSKLGLLRGSSGDARARAAFEILLRLVRNIVDSPYDARYRRVRADNPRVRAGLLGAGPAAEEMMSLLGFEATTEAGERVFVLRDATFDCARLRLGKELLEQQLAAAAVSAH